MESEEEESARWGENQKYNGILKAKERQCFKDSMTNFVNCALRSSKMSIAKLNTGLSNVEFPVSLNGGFCVTGRRGSEDSKHRKLT